VEYAATQKPDELEAEERAEHAAPNYRGSDTKKHPRMIPGVYELGVVKTV